MSKETTDKVSKVLSVESERDRIIGALLRAFVIFLDPSEEGDVLGALIYVQKIMMIASEKSQQPLILGQVAEKLALDSAAEFFRNLGIGNTLREVMLTAEKGQISADKFQEVQKATDAWFALGTINN